MFRCPRHSYLYKPILKHPTDLISILYLSHCGSSVGGGEKQLYYLVTNMNRERYHPLVVCPDDGIFAEQLRHAGISTLILNLPPWRKTKSLFARYRAATKLVNIARTNNAQLVHTSDSWLNPYAWYVRQQLSIPIISHVRNILTAKQVRKYGFHQMNRIIAISEQSRAPLLQAGIDAKKVNVILNCVDLSVFRPSSSNLTPCKKEFIVGIVGRIEPFKRQKTFVEIASHAIRQWEVSANSTCKLPPPLRFHIIGAALDTLKHRAYEREVHQLVAQRNIAAQGAHDSQFAQFFYFMGHRNDMPQAMQELDLLVTLSAGSVIAEAMASGKPVIGTPIGSTLDMIVDGVTGWVIPLPTGARETRGVEAIASRIVHLAKMPQFCTQAGKAARKRAEETFGIEAQVENIRGIYEELLD